MFWTCKIPAETVPAILNLYCFPITPAPKFLDKYPLAEVEAKVSESVIVALTADQPDVKSRLPTKFVILAFLYL